MATVVIVIEIPTDASVTFGFKYNHIEYLNWPIYFRVCVVHIYIYILLLFI